MKYFTPELLARCRSLDDATHAAASEEWDAAHEAYEASLPLVYNAAPVAMRRALRLAEEQFTLHDASLTTVIIGRARKELTLIFNLGTPATDGSRCVIMTYRLVGRLPVKMKKGPGAPGSAVVLQDEFALAGKPRVFTHSLLFGDGLIMNIRLRNLRTVIAGQVSFGPELSALALEKAFALA